MRAAPHPGADRDPPDSRPWLRVTTRVSSSHRPPKRARLKCGPAIEGFKIIGVLGRGGMAIVYVARQLCPKRLVAIKVIDPNLAGYPEIVARFCQEQALAKRLTHPNLVKAYDAGWAGGCPYLSMELVRGDSLDGLARRHGPLPVAQACEVIRQAALGLQHLHEHGVVHRDVKPSNLMLSRRGRVKVLDLGLARDLRSAGEAERITSHGECLGTLDYLAPEQCLDPHAVDSRADVYGLGCTLYELLAGQAPFAGSTYGSAFLKMKAHVEAPVPPIGGLRPDVPAPLAVALGRMVAKDPRGRFACPADVVAAMQPFAAGSDLVGLSERLAPRAVPAA